MVEPDDGPVEENFQIRAALESLGASLAARKIDAGGIGAAAGPERPDAGARRRRPPVRGPEPGLPLHACTSTRGSPLLLSLMRLLWASLHGGPQVLRTHAESARQHDAILDALSAGDAAAAAARTYQHIMSAAPVTGR